MLYWLQHFIVTEKSSSNGFDFYLDDFCYKPITGEGCLVEGPLQYFHDDQETLENLTNE